MYTSCTNRVQVSLTNNVVISRIQRSGINSSLSNTATVADLIAGSTDGDCRRNDCRHNDRAGSHGDGCCCHNKTTAHKQHLDTASLTDKKMDSPVNEQQDLNLVDQLTHCYIVRGIPHCLSITAQNTKAAYSF